MMISYFLLPLAAGFPSAIPVTHLEDSRTLAHSQPETRKSYEWHLEITDVPWIVSLQLYGRHHCGGTIYSDRIIITAAKCFYSDFGINFYRLVDAKEFLVVAGSKFKSSRDYIVAVSRTWHHEKFTINPLSIEHDIGILRVRKPLRTCRHVQPIPLALASPKPGSIVVSTGWRQMIGQETQNSSSEILEMAIFYVTPYSYCQQSLPRSANHTICTGIGYSGCKGDPGGSLVFRNTLVGILSGGPLICIGPIAFTSVAHYRKWLIHAAETIH